MRTPPEAAIRSDAVSIWEESGRPIWSHPLDHWSEAIERLSRHAGASDEPAAPTIVHAPTRRKALRRSP
jgi:hypothetical protein